MQIHLKRGAVGLRWLSGEVEKERENVLELGVKEAQKYERLEKYLEIGVNNVYGRVEK